MFVSKRNRPLTAHQEYVWPERVHKVSVHLCGLAINTTQSSASDACGRAIALRTIGLVPEAERESQGQKGVED
jgi:hypothetical protein